MNLLSDNRRSNVTTPQELNRALIENIDSVLPYLLPKGKRVGKEWQIGSIHGEEGSSCSICMSGNKAGVWRDFADTTNIKGSDLVGLWCAVRRTTFVEGLKEISEYVGVNYEPRQKLQSTKKYKTPEKPKTAELSTVAISWFAARNIREPVLKTLKITEQGNVLVFPYYSPGGNLERIKYRSMEEKKIWSSTDSVPCLFGWQSIDDDDRYVVICEGEIDQLTYQQAGIPCLSVPFGGGDGAKQDWIEHEYDRLLRFETIYLSFDNDEQGAKGTAECLGRLARERCKVIKLPEKDANEVLMKNPDYCFYNALGDAQSVDPEELQQLADFHDDAMNLLLQTEEACKDLYLPWCQKLSTIRFRLGEVSVWAGVNSHGKSVILSHLVVDGINQGFRWCIASLEMTPARQSEKMYRQIGGTDRPTRSFGYQIKDFIKDRVWVFNLVGRAKGSRILDVFLYAKRKYGITHFVIDSLSKCGFRDDDYPTQKEFVDVLMEFARENHVHIHLVMHMRKTESEGKMGGKFDLKGSGGISDMADNVFILWRNKNKENAMQGHDEAEKEKHAIHPDAILNCVKQRVTGEEPRVCLWYDKKSCQYLSNSQDSIRRYITNASNLPNDI